tara:strand:- start:314 stop:679 length:366 start_codon:yes stop_codon:yes gene_type:complete
MEHDFKVTLKQVRQWLGSDWSSKDVCETLQDLANGDYKPEQLKEDIRSTYEYLLARQESLLIQKLKEWCTAENIKYQSADEILHFEKLTENQKQWVMDYMKEWESHDLALRYGKNSLKVYY